MADPRIVVWSDAMDAHLRAMWIRGDLVVAIGRALRVNPKAIMRRTRKIGLQPRANPASLFWTHDRCKTGADLRDQGKSWVEIVGVTGGTASSAEFAIGQWRRRQANQQVQSGPMVNFGGRPAADEHRVNGALPPGHPRTWGPIAPGVPYPGPGHV